MFRSRSILDTVTRSDARHQAEITSWWRDWHRWLRAQLQLLDARQAEATTPPSFERTEEAWEQQRAEAEQTLRRIPHDRRAVFDRTRAASRAETEAQVDAQQRTNGAMPQARDPDTVERETLERLLAQAEGSSDDVEQWGAVPMPGGWYELRVDALLRAPAAAEYAVAPEDGDERRKRVALLLGLLVLGCVSVWWTWPRGQAVAPAPATEVLVNGQAAERWPISSVTVVDGADRRTTLPVRATHALTWETRQRAEDGAWWRTTAVHPLQLCLPATVLETANQLELRSGDVPTRRYTLTLDRVSQPDLLVHACGTDAASSLRSGVLEGTTMLPDHPLDAPVTISPDVPTLTVDEVDVLGPGQDPQMPTDKYRVVVRVAAPGTIDWVALAPRLVLRTGLELLPSDPVMQTTDSDVVEVTYLAPVWQSPMEAAWSVTEPRTEARVRWRVMLDPPTSRAQVLREAFDITVTGTRGPEPGSVTAHVTLRNTSATTLVLTDADLAIMQGDRAIPVSTVGTAGLAITPLHARTIEVPLRGLDLTREVSVRIGAAGFRLRFDAEEKGGTASGSPRP